MQMRIHMTGIGLTVPGTSAGVNVATYATISFRSVSNTTPYRLELLDYASRGSETGTAALSNVKTDWFVINMNRYPWLHRTNRLINRRARLRLSGTTLFAGRLDVSLSILDVYGNVEKEFKTMVQDSIGFQISSTQVTGRIKPWNPDRVSEALLGDEDTAKVD